MGITTPSLKKEKQFVTNCYVGTWTWADSMERPKQQKVDMRCSTRNVRSPCRTGSLTAAAGETANCSTVS
jgi:hypothetical protein